MTFITTLCVFVLKKKLWHYLIVILIHWVVVNAKSNYLTINIISIRVVKVRSCSSWYLVYFHF